jgi:hypothetical protein
MFRLDLSEIVMDYLVPWRLLMVVRPVFWHDLWAILMDLCSIIFHFGDLISLGSRRLLHTDEMEEAPSKMKNAAASLPDDLLLKILRRLLAIYLFRCRLVCRD